AQYPEGYWIKPGGGYSPKYRSTLWQIRFLADFGADGRHPRVRRACEYVLAHSLTANGAFSAYQKPAPSGAVLCLNGNLAHALIRLGYRQDARVQKVIEWLAGAITGEEGFRYHKSATCGPGFRCAVNGGQPCAWGANKALKALLAIPPQLRSARQRRALDAGAAFLLGHDPAKADYPYTQRVSSTWFKLGFPLTYWSDVLETVENLVALGFGHDPRLAPALAWIMEKRDADGRWPNENPLAGKTWFAPERRGGPSKWVTSRVLRVLKALGEL
ncbi:MAG: nitrogen fixation protein NifH, partial [Caldilineae bacterium]